MKEPGLDDRHRDANGQISRKHGNTYVETLRMIYGASFATGFPPKALLADTLATLDQPSLTHLIRHHEDGSLERRIKEVEKG